MLDLFYPPKAQHIEQIVARSRVSHQHLIDDDKPPPMRAAKPEAVAVAAARKYHDGSRSKWAAKRLQRQTEIVQMLHVKAQDSVFTVQQIIYHCMFSGSENSREAVQKDCDALYQRGILGRKKVTSKLTNKRIWAYWLKGK